MDSLWRINPPQTTNPLRFFMFVSRPYRVAAFGALLAVASAAALNAGSSYAYKLIVDAATNIGTTEGVTALWTGALIYIAFSFSSGIAWRISGYIGMYWGTGVRATARYTLTEYVTKHSHQYFSDRFAGSISSKITQAASSSKEMVEQILWQFTGFVVTMIASFVLMYTTNHLVAWIFIAWVAFIVPFNLYLARRRTPYSTATQKAETVLSGATVDVLTNISAVKEYVGRSFELTRLKDFILGRRNTGLSNWRYGETVLLANNILQDLFTGGMILISVYLMLQGVISPGDIALTLTLILIAEDRLTFIGQQINHFADAWGQVVESLEDIVKPHEISDEPEAELLVPVNASIEFSHVSFNYDGVKVFDDLELVIPAGQRVGLVGRSGAGKSTLMKLLLRNYTVQEGKVLIGAKDVSQVTQESLRQVTAVVPQEPLLFHRTIRENIAYGKPGAAEADVVRAAELAQAHEFIARLPQGYEALVGERGVKLSGGQRQRVAIARAILKDAPILLLDEATSSLDSESEVAVQRALLALMEGRTVIAIAHRLSTLRAMNRIIVMDQGKIVEDGTHDELIEKKGLYAELWAHQAGGFLEE